MVYVVGVLNRQGIPAAIWRFLLRGWNRGLGNPIRRVWPCFTGDSLGPASLQFVRFGSALSGAAVSLL